MKTKIVAAGTMLAACLVCASAIAQSGLAPSGLSARYVNIRDRKMEETGGLNNPERYRHLRVSSDRFLTSLHWTLGSSLDIQATAGAADLTLHWSEGQTIEFSHALALGAGMNALLYEFPDTPFSLAMGMAFLWFGPDSGSIIGVQEPVDHPDFLSWDEVEVSWTEFQAAVLIATELPRGRLDSGLRFEFIPADLEGHDDSFGLAADLDQDEYVGAFLGLEYDLADNLTGRCQVEIFDETALTLGIGCRF